MCPLNNQHYAPPETMQRVQVISVIVRGFHHCVYSSPIPWVVVPNPTYQILPILPIKSKPTAFDPALL